MLSQLTLTQAAKHFGLNEKTIRKHLQAGKLSGQKVKGRWIVSVESETLNLPSNKIVSIRKNNNTGISDNKGISDNTDISNKLIEQLKSENAFLRNTIQDLQSALTQEQKALDQEQKLNLAHTVRIQQLEQNQSSSQPRVIRWLANLFG